MSAYDDPGFVREPIHGLSVATLPNVSESIVEQTRVLEVKHIWFQLGTESGQAIFLLMEFRMSVNSSIEILLL